LSRPILILGSSSPRRKDLLAAVGLGYEVIKPDVDETPRPGEVPEAYARRNAEEKADWVARHLAGRASGYPAGAIVISADTIVVLGDDILEKPRDKEHAAAMLTRLGGRTHTVISGVTLLGTLAPRLARRDTFAVRTAVQMKPLSRREIDAYIRTGEPLDKAGAYAAQGIGSYMVQRIEGSYANVVGLPVAEVVERLERDFAYPLWGNG
jgi:septum formation protein